MNELKKKKCHQCKKPFIPFSSLAKTCSVECSIIHVRGEKVKKQRRQDKLKKELLKTRGDWLRELQTIFNQFIRLRDEGGVCISCQKLPKKKNAGHYRSVGACPELRLNELNVHLQCEACNTSLSGNLINYRINLIAKIGIKNVEYIEGPHEPLKLTIPDIKDLKVVYRDKIKEMESLK